MQKDVIYIDVEDDITAIISKVKAADKMVVALVPPKRIGVLQSAVNLQLLARAAKQNDKKLAIVTTNQALMALARAASIPVARNLQSKPELAEVDNDDDAEEEDIIDGAELPVGDHARQALGAQSGKKPKSAAVQEIFDEAEAGEPGEDADQKPTAKKSAVKIPNFNKFRKRLILGIGAGIFLIIFLVWAVVFAPRATVLISAKTTSSSVNSPVTIKAGAKTDYKKSILKAAEKTDSEEKSITFTPTGEKDVGKKASGEVSFKKSSPGEASVPAGTKLETSGGLVFVLDSSVTVPGATLSFSCQPNNLCPGEASGTVTAEENGSKYNAATGSLSGAPGSVSASLDGPTSGGVSKTVDIVTAADVQKAKQQLVDEDVDVIRDDLLEEFDSSTKGVPESFAIGYKNVNASPAVGEEASSATLSATVVYTVYGVEKTELDTFLDAYMKNELRGTEGQQVYKNGADDVVFQEAGKSKAGATATLVATAQVGPQIKDSDVKEQARGKRYGEIQEAFTSVQGVEKVDVKFFPFWVSTVPNDDKKITIEFTIDESN